MKNILINILNFFGLTTLKDQAETVNHLISVEKELVEKAKNAEDKLYQSELKYNRLFDWKLLQETLITYNQYLESKGIERNYDMKRHHDIFYDYWDNCLANELQALTIRKLSMNPEMLNAFLLEFIAYDFEDIEKFMKSVNWCWSDRDRTPTIDELKRAVIELVPLDFNDEKNGTSSGGFKVSLYYKDGKPYCNISFDKKDLMHLY